MAMQCQRYGRSRVFSTSPFLNSIQERQPSARITELVDTISGLSLLETADLVRLLKTRLNLPDIPMMAQQAVPAAAQAAAGAAAPAKEAPPAAPPKSEFQITLVKYDAAAKAKIIREVKNLIPGMSLVEAKTFVESAPKVLKEKAKKEEAEQLKKVLEELGATVQLD